MSDLWIPVIAALGASLLTGASAFGLEWWRTSRTNKAAQAERRVRAYTLLLARSAVILHTANDFHVIMDVRSGFREGVNMLLRTQKPLDPLELLERMRTDLQPLYEAWSEVWTVGSKEAIAEANDLVARCGAVIGAATQPGEAVPRFLRGFTGEKWTQDQLNQWQEEMRGLAAARKRLGEIARREVGMKPVDLFISNEAKTITPPVMPSHTPVPTHTPDSKPPSSNGRPPSPDDASAQVGDRLP
jgi:hypothetical protein